MVPDRSALWRRPCEPTDSSRWVLCKENEANLELIYLLSRSPMSSAPRAGDASRASTSPEFTRLCLNICKVLPLAPIAACVRNNATYYGMDDSRRFHLSLL